MKFRGYETFSIRNGWLCKGLQKIKENPYFFTDKTIDQTVELGIGSNMVKAIRYYLTATGLTDEKRGQGITATKFGDLIFEYDKYLQKTGTLILLHYNLAINKDNATSWYFFFNEYSAVEINKNSFLLQIRDFIKQNGENEIAERSLRDDYDCIIKTYLPRNKKESFEDNLQCPLSDLGLLINGNKKLNIDARKTSINIENVPEEIALYIIKKNNKENQNEIKISHIEKGIGSLGKTLNLSITETSEILEKLENDRKIKITRTAGIETIRFLNEAIQKDCDDYLNEYYKKQVRNE